MSLVGKVPVKRYCVSFQVLEIWRNRGQHSGNMLSKQDFIIFKMELLKMSVQKRVFSEKRWLEFLKNTINKSKLFKKYVTLDSLDSRMCWKRMFLVFDIKYCRLLVINQCFSFCKLNSHLWKLYGCVHINRKIQSRLFVVLNIPTK